LTLELSDYALKGKKVVGKNVIVSDKTDVYKKQQNKNCFKIKKRSKRVPKPTSLVEMKWRRKKLFAGGRDREENRDENRVYFVPLPANLVNN
jgi:hypothetical protein